MPLKSSKSLKKKCDILWSKIIRSKGYCERCGKTSFLQGAHIYSRRYANTRHLLANGLCLCAGCHMWGHHRPTDFTDWVREKLGEDMLSHLREASLSTSKVDYNRVYAELRALEAQCA